MSVWNPHDCSNDVEWKSMDFIGFQTIYVPRVPISRGVIGLSLGWFKGNKGKMLQEGWETMIFQGHKTICSKCNHYVREPATWTSIIHLLKSFQIYGPILFDLQFWLPMKFSDVLFLRPLRGWRLDKNTSLMTMTICFSMAALGLIVADWRVSGSRMGTVHGSSGIYTLGWSH